MEERLIAVEVKMDGVLSAMSDVKASLKDIATSLSKLAVLEEKHNSASEAIKRAFIAIERNTGRIDEIEKVLPDMKLASGWVFKAVLAVMGLLGMAAVMTIMKG